MAHDLDGDTVLTIYAILAVLFLMVYLMPWFIAKWRGHPRSGALFVINVFLGWTFAVWVGCLVWAISEEREQQEYNPLTDPEYIKMMLNKKPKKPPYIV